MKRNFWKVVEERRKASGEIHEATHYVETFSEVMEMAESAGNDAYVTGFRFSRVYLRT